MSTKDSPSPRSFVVGDVEFVARSPFSNSAKDISVHQRETFDFVGRLTCTLLEKWGMVQAEDGGEDSAGRAKLSLMPVDQVVNRALEMAELAYRRLQETGHVHAVPQYADFLSDSVDE